MFAPLTKQLMNSLRLIFSSQADNMCSRFEKHIEHLGNALPDEKPPAPPPPSDEAFARLAAVDDMSQLSLRDRNSICWGMGKPTKDNKIPLRENTIFDKVDQFVSNSIRNGNLRRNNFLGLVYSYFDFQEGGTYCRFHNWLKLRERIGAAVKRYKSRYENMPRRWFTTITKHQSIFDGNASSYVGKLIFDDNKNDLTDIKSLSLPNKSWLWNESIGSCLSILCRKDDLSFLNAYPKYLQLIDQMPDFKDKILGTILNHYCNTRYAGEVNEYLKSKAIEFWGYPQIASSRDHWLYNVSEITLKRVLNWVARDDLKIFFQLLRDSSEPIDKDRFEFWLSYVGSMTFTRIYLGTHARSNWSIEFKKFREDNEARLGAITDGGPNDAFVMELGDLVVVEFSKTGNACYFYDRNNMPFDIFANETRIWRMKNQRVHEKRLSHFVGKWQWEAKAFLEEHNIYPDKDSMLANKKRFDEPDSFSPEYNWRRNWNR